MFLSQGVEAELPSIALADAYPSVANANYYPTTSLALTDYWASYGSIYKTQPWIAALVNKLAFGTSRLPLKVYQRQDVGRIEARDTPFARLLRQPNRRHDPFFFWLWTASTFEVYGEAIWYKMRPAPGLPPTELYPVHPANVYTRRDQDGSLIYVFHLGSAATPLMEWPERDVVHFRSYNPDNQVRGLSRLEPLRGTLVNEDAMRRAQGAFWANGARPSVILEHPNKLSEPAQARVKASWDAAHSGVSSWGKAAILEEGMKANVVQLNATEMAYIDAKKLNREEACGVYDVPPPVVHILDHATFSNITEQMRSMYRDTMAPRLGLYESALDSQLRPDFDPQGVLYAEFLLDEVLRGAFEQRAIANQSAIMSGQRTPNELRTQDNLPPLPGGDKLYINSASIPLESAQDSPAPGDAGIEPSPVKVKSLDGGGLLDLCQSCGLEPPTPAHGMCRSCEGRSARAQIKGDR